VSEFQDAETGTASVRYPVKGGRVVDGTFGVLVWRNVGVAVGVSQFSKKNDATVTAQIPHPFFLNRFRSIEGTTRTTRNETGVHLQLAYLLPVGRRVRTVVFAGPSRLTVEQTFATDVQFAQQYPYDTATFSGATTRRSSNSATGFNVGADLFWMFGRRIGAGGLAQFVQARVREDAGHTHSISLDAGGVHVAGGVRVVF
jgi:hypothetical protein